MKIKMLNWIGERSIWRLALGVPFLLLVSLLCLIFMLVEAISDRVYAFCGWASDEVTAWMNEPAVKPAASSDVEEANDA